MKVIGRAPSSTTHVEPNKELQVATRQVETKKLAYITLVWKDTVRSIDCGWIFLNVLWIFFRGLWQTFSSKCHGGLSHNPNNHAACHVTCAWQDVQFGDWGLDSWVPWTSCCLTCQSWSQAPLHQKFKTQVPTISWLAFGARDWTSQVSSQELADCQNPTWGFNCALGMWTPGVGYRSSILGFSWARAELVCGVLKVSVYWDPRIRLCQPNPRVPVPGVEQHMGFQRSWCMRTPGSGCWDCCVPGPALWCSWISGFIMGLPQMATCSAEGVIQMNHKVVVCYMWNNCMAN